MNMYTHPKDYILVHIQIILSHPGHTQRRHALQTEGVFLGILKVVG